VVGSVTETASRLGADGRAYERLLSPFVADALGVTDAVLAPIRSVPASPVVATRFAFEGIRSASGLAGRFSTEEARGLLAGVAAHAMLPLDAPTSGGFGLLLATLAHAVGWPVVEGGSARIVDALVGELERLGGHIVTGRRIQSLRELSPARATLLDLDPAQLVSLAGAALPAARRRAMLGFRHGPGVCKVDWAIDGPVPWDAEPCLAAGTLHLGGSFEEIARSEADVAAGRHPDRPYTIVVQPAVVDGSRAPQGRSTLWAYCHVPGGSTIDMTERIERQIERFAPGFRDRILARTTMTAADMAAHNANYVGGDINGGAASLRQTLFRPTVRWNPYRTGIDGVYLCSASTSPGGGVHGMCGFGAATTALRDLGVGRSMRGSQRR
jgi:phytoene dehydrogenase-like protein